MRTIKKGWQLKKTYVTVSQPISRKAIFIEEEKK